MYRAVTQRCHFSGFVCLFVCLFAILFLQFWKKKKVTEFYRYSKSSWGNGKDQIWFMWNNFRNWQFNLRLCITFYEGSHKEAEPKSSAGNIKRGLNLLFFFFYRTVTAIINFALWKSTSWRITILLFFLPLLPHFWNMFPRLIEISLDGAELISRIQPLGADNVTGRRLMETSAFIVMNYS